MCLTFVRCHQRETQSTEQCLLVRGSLLMLPDDPLAFVFSASVFVDTRRPMNKHLAELVLFLSALPPWTLQTRSRPSGEKQLGPAPADGGRSNYGSGKPRRKKSSSRRRGCTEFERMLQSKLECSKSRRPGISKGDQSRVARRFTTVFDVRVHTSVFFFSPRACCAPSTTF